MRSGPAIRICRRRSRRKDVAAVVDAADRAGLSRKVARLEPLVCVKVIEVLKSAFIVACTLGVVLSAQETFLPARYRAGTVPALAVMALGGGQVFLELAVSREGRVTAVTPLRTTPPFTDLVIDAVRDWQFLPAEERVELEPGRAGVPESRTPVATKVLVAAVFRPPALNTPTLGEAPRDIASASDETAFPLTTTVPPFPPLAHSSGAVLLEAQVDRNGAVAGAAVIRSAPPFDDAAQEAVAQWSFRPARVRGIPVATLVYILLGFPVPVGSAPMVPGGPRDSAESFSRIAARSAFQGRAIGVRQGMKSEAARCGSSC